MLRGLMGRLQVRFSPKETPKSKSDIWRLATVDPLMVSSGEDRAWGSLWHLGVCVGTQCLLSFS